MWVTRANAARLTSDQRLPGTALRPRLAEAFTPSPESWIGRRKRSGAVRKEQLKGVSWGRNGKVCNAFRDHKSGKICCPPPKEHPSASGWRPVYPSDGHSGEECDYGWKWMRSSFSRRRIQEQKRRSCSREEDGARVEVTAGVKGWGQR